jgi:hypothetical protein
MALPCNREATDFIVKKILENECFFTKIISQSFYFFREIFDKTPHSELRWDCMSNEAMRTTMLEF